eukprot:Phypoly_transcript_11007.p1 GENE.Phypoly_transcript_11007~~Phypoly_transcript_11007.p1  ORF type:complete len:335 (+),score=75.31 Phypoly_transcript_11007:244-1248(+)
MKVIALVVLSVCFLAALARAQVTLQANSTFQWYQPYTVQWSDSDASHQDDDYVGVYNSSGVYQEVRGQIASSVTSGTVNIDPVQVPGQYYFAYVRLDGSIAATFNFTVTANVTLSTPPTVTIGQPIVITYHVSPFLGQSGFGDDDYIALYHPNDTYYKDYVNGQYAYVTQTNGVGSVTFGGYFTELPSFVAIYRAGKDEAANYGNVVPVQVVSGVTLTPRHPRFGLHEDIVIDYTAPANHSTGDYIYLIKGSIDNSYLKYALVPAGSTSGNVTFPQFTSTGDLGTYYVTYKSSDTLIVANNTFTLSVVGSGATALAPCFALVAAFIFVVLQFLM